MHGIPPLLDKKLQYLMTGGVQNYCNSTSHISTLSGTSEQEYNNITTVNLELLAETYS